MDKQSEQILCVFQSPGSVHDFKMYKESIGSAVSSEFLFKADSGYQGLASYHSNSELPTKMPKGGQLTAEGGDMILPSKKKIPSLYAFPLFFNTPNLYNEPAATSNHRCL